MKTREETDFKAEERERKKVDESSKRNVAQVQVAHSADDRRDEQPTVLQHGERRVPDHVLNVVIETVRTCKVTDGR